MTENYCFTVGDDGQKSLVLLDVTSHNNLGDSSRPNLGKINCLTNDNLIGFKSVVVAKNGDINSVSW